MISTTNGIATALVLLGSLGAATFVSHTATAEPPSAADVDRWVTELGDDSYPTRKAAAERLATGGYAAHAALSKAAEGTDPEIRTSARRLLTLIDDSEFDRRLAEFAADVDGKQGVSLPGWQEFGDLVGRDAAARALFVDMQREEAPLLARTFATTPDKREIAWEQHVGRLIRARVFNQSQSNGLLQSNELAAPMGSCATLLFLGALADANVSDSGARSLVQLTQIPPLSESLAANRSDTAVRRLIAAWIVGCPNRSEQVVAMRLQIMIQQQLAEALPLALEIIGRDPKYLTISPSLQMTAIMAVGKLGSEQHVAAIEPLLEDRSEIQVGQQINGMGAAGGTIQSLQVRDVALAVLLHLTEQEPLTYGYLHAQANPQTVFDVQSLTLENDERRAAAAERWRAWRVQHKLDKPRPASS